MNKKEVFAWSIYDMANTAFSALFVTFFYPLYIKHFLGGTEFQIGLVFGLSMLLVALFVPFIGAFSDRLGKRIPFIMFFTVVCCLFTFAVVFVGLKFALLFGFIANFFYHAALTVYNALLPKIAKKHEWGWVSGIGVAVGYAGTLLSLVMAVIILNYFGWESTAGIKAMFPATALFFFGFSLITYVFIKEKRNKKNNLSKDIKHSFSAVANTLKNIKKHKGLLFFIGSMFMYVNAINAVIVFLYLYGRAEIGLSVKSFMLVYIIFALAAVVGSFIFGKITDVIGPKRTLGIAGFIWLITSIILFNVSSLTAFFIAGILGGIALGTVWTAMRPLTIQLSPKKNIGQFFGFVELTDKFSGVIGPIIFGFLATNFNYKIAILSLLVFFAAGLVLLWFVPGDKR
ncbi:MFS transporter [Candidatus Woesearchaeota archaeon]|nr:MFS transporter [Candidatus Woesearchaeota archaeon]